jgi:hypothetical protein
VNSVWRVHRLAGFTVPGGTTNPGRGRLHVSLVCGLWMLARNGLDEVLIDILASFLLLL